MNEQTATALARDLYAMEQRTHGTATPMDFLRLLERYQLVKRDVMRNYRCDGQMSIADFPQYLPETGAEEYIR